VYRVFGWPGRNYYLGYLCSPLGAAEQTGQTRKAAEGAQRAADAAFAQIEFDEEQGTLRLSISPLPTDRFLGRMNLKR